MKVLFRLAWIALFAAATIGGQAATRLPNIVIIFADDLGYADVGVYGAKGYKTPNIDGLAREGTMFRNFHVAQPVCSASRAALLTGCYPNRIGLNGALGPSTSLRQSLCSSQATLNQFSSCAPAALIRFHAACRTASLNVPDASVTTKTS